MSVQQVIIRSIKASIGLVIFAFGTYLTVQADIGVSPWDVFSKGISYNSSLTYGQAAIVISVVIIILDLFLKEKIGIGTVLDAFIVGTALDIFEGINLMDKSENFVVSIIMITLGMFIMAYSQYLYMSAGLGCGPRDSFLVGLGKRFKKVPIGIVNIVLMSVVLIIGFFLGGPVGIGTVYTVVGMGTVMQIVFNILKFEPREIKHVSIMEMIKK